MRRWTQHQAMIATEAISATPPAAAMPMIAPVEGEEPLVGEAVEVVVGTVVVGAAVGTAKVLG